MRKVMLPDRRKNVVVVDALPEDGKPGLPASVLVGSVAIGQSAVVAIALGVRDVTAALPGVVAGERYIAFCRSYRLNGGPVTNGQPVGYYIVGALCNADGTIIVRLNAPLLAIGASYSMNCDILKL